MNNKNEKLEKAPLVLYFFDYGDNGTLDILTRVIHLHIPADAVCRMVEGGDALWKTVCEYAKKSLNTPPSPINTKSPWPQTAYLVDGEADGIQYEVRILSTVEIRRLGYFAEKRIPITDVAVLTEKGTGKMMYGFVTNFSGLASFAQEHNCEYLKMPDHILRYLDRFSKQAAETHKRNMMSITKVVEEWKRLMDEHPKKDEAETLLDVLERRGYRLVADASWMETEVTTKPDHIEMKN